MRRKPRRHLIYDPLASNPRGGQIPGAPWEPLPRYPRGATARWIVSDQLGEDGARMKAHQRIIRERRAAEDADVDLFGRWWQGINLAKNI
jgi:hypothetical protein